MKKKPFAIALLIILAAPGCASIDNTMQSWVGHAEGDLIASWGPPQQTTTDGRGGHILIYSSYRNFGQTPGTYGGGYYTAPRQNGYTATRMFYVHENGIIYSWRWQGL